MKEKRALLALNIKKPRHDFIGEVGSVSACFEFETKDIP